MADQSAITVIGAGMVGTCCALYLRNEGFAVTLIDRGGPGEGVTRLASACDGRPGRTDSPLIVISARRFGRDPG